MGYSPWGHKEWDSTEHAHEKKNVFHVIVIIKSSFSKCHFSVYTEEGNLSKYLIFITFFTAMKNGNHLKDQLHSLSGIFCNYWFSFFFFA